MPSKSKQLMTELRKVVDQYQLPDSMFCATKAIAMEWQREAPGDGECHANQLRDDLIMAVMLSKRAPREYGGRHLEDACKEYATALATTGECTPKGEAAAHLSKDDLASANIANALKVTHKIAKTLGDMIVALKASWLE